MYLMLHADEDEQDGNRRSRAGARHRLGAAAGAPAAALGLALLLALVPAVVLRVGGPDTWWLAPFVLLGLLSAGGLAVVLLKRSPSDPPDDRG